MIQDHILNHTNIITDFNVSKRVTEREMKEIQKRVSRACDDKNKLGDLFKKELMRYTGNYIKQHSVPGIIAKEDSTEEFKWVEPARRVESAPDTTEGSVNKKRLSVVHNESIMLADYLVNAKKLTRNEMLYFIITLVGILGLEDSDFKKYQEKKNTDVDDEESEDDADAAE